MDTTICSQLPSTPTSSDRRRGTPAPAPTPRTSASRVLVVQLMFAAIGASVPGPTGLAVAICAALVLMRWDLSARHRWAHALEDIAVAVAWCVLDAPAGVVRLVGIVIVIGRFINETVDNPPVRPVEPHPHDSNPDRDQFNAARNTDANDSSRR